MAALSSSSLLSSFSSSLPLSSFSSSSSSSLSLSSSSLLSPFLQLMQWFERSKLSSEPLPLIIDGGIPQVTIYVEFPLGLSKYLKIPPNINTREDFLIFLMENIELNSFEIKRLYKGEIWADIKPIDTDPETEEFFRKFVDKSHPNRDLHPTPSFALPAVLEEDLKISPDITTRKEFELFLVNKTGMTSYDVERMVNAGMLWRAHPSTVKVFQKIILEPGFYRHPNPAPSFVKPISQERRASFELRYPSRFCAKPFETCSELPQINITVSINGELLAIVRIPPNIKTRRKFLQFLSDNVPLPPTVKKTMFDTGMLLATVKPINTDSATVDFFEKFLSNYKYPTPLIPSFTVCVKFPYSNALFLKIPPNTIRSNREFKRLLFDVADKVNMPSHIKAYIFKSGEMTVQVSLVDTLINGDPEVLENFNKIVQPDLLKSLNRSVDFDLRIEDAPLRLKPQSLEPIPLIWPSSTTTVPTPAVESQFPKIHIDNDLRSLNLCKQLISDYENFPLHISSQSVEAESIAPLSSRSLTPIPSVSPSSTTIVSTPNIESKLSKINIKPPANTKPHQIEVDSITPLKSHSLEPIPLIWPSSTTVLTPAVESQFPKIHIDNDDLRSLNLCKQLVSDYEKFPLHISISSQPVETESVAPLRPRSLTPVPSVLPSSTTIVSTPNVDSKLSRINIKPPVKSKPRKIECRMIINNQMETPYFLTVPLKINFVKFRELIRKSLIKQEWEVHSKFTIFGGGYAINSDDKLKDIFNDSSVALHIFGVKPAAKSSIHRFSVNRSGKLPKRLIHIALPVIFSDYHHRDISNSHYTVQITREISSFNRFKLFLSETIPALSRAKCKNFDVIGMMDDNLIRIDSKEELMFYFEQIPKFSIPFFACIGR